MRMQLAAEAKLVAAHRPLELAQILANGGCDLGGRKEIVDGGVRRDIAVRTLAVGDRVRTIRVCQLQEELARKRKILCRESVHDHPLKFERGRYTEVSIFAFAIRGS